MSAPALRKRTASEPVVTAYQFQTPQTPPNNSAPASSVSGIRRVLAGLFGSANSAAMTSSAEVDPRNNALYAYHEGDVFTPGTGNYVFVYPFEFPLQTIWGGAFLRRANTFNPEQPPQIYSQPNIVINGIGGLVAGQFATQPLETDGD